MNKILIYAFSLVLFSCSSDIEKNTVKVENNSELKEAIKNAEAGSTIEMANGVWRDVQIKLYGEGKENSPIKVVAQTPGKVFIEGNSSLKIGGKYIEVEGLYFRNGHSPSSSLIRFKTNDTTIASHCSVNNCVIENFTQSDRSKKDHWVEFWGQNNSLTNCYISGKSNSGPTIRVMLKGNQNINTHHIIENNYFGPRPRKGGPHGETLQIGDSYTSMTPSYVIVKNNYFDECNGEVEVISNKSNFNEFRNNVFYKCEGSLVLRHGNYAIVDANVFIGDENSDNIGGIRVVNTGHWITNNYFINLKGNGFRSPIAVMNGIPKSPLNRYNQVTDVVIAYNTWVNCVSPLQFGVGVNTDKVGVLPKSEIRSAVPVRTIVADNVIYNEKSTDKPILVAYDRINGVKFKSNLVSSTNPKLDDSGFNFSNFNLNKNDEITFTPSEETLNLFSESFYGFDFDKISSDILGNKRSENSLIGCITEFDKNTSLQRNLSKYGPTWFNPNSNISIGKRISVESEKMLIEKLANAKDGDTLELDNKDYSFNNSLIINKDITITGKKGGSKSKISFSNKLSNPAIIMNAGSKLHIENVKVVGKSTSSFIEPNSDDMSRAFDVYVDNCSISGFTYLIKSAKGAFSDNIIIENSTIDNLENGLVFNFETDAKGEYNAEFVVLKNNKISNVKNRLIDYYRGGYDESTIGGNLSLYGNEISNSGVGVKDLLINTHGIVNVDISNNKFSNNKCELIARLWGEKNNTHSNNKIIGKGNILVKEHLEQKLFY